MAIVIRGLYGKLGRLTLAFKEERATLLDCSPPQTKQYKQLKRGWLGILCEE